MSLVPDVNASVEQYPSKVTASFRSSSDAAQAAARLAEDGEVEKGQIKVVAPEDQDIDRKLQPEARAIERTFFRRHRNFGISGLVAGLFLSTLAITMGPEAFYASPQLTVITVTWVTFLSSLMLAGALTLRMDHDLIMNHAKQASGQGLHVVVAHARTAPQKRQFANELRAKAERVVSTL